MLYCCHGLGCLWHLVSPSIQDLGDLNRLTIEFEDLYAMALLHHCMCSMFDVVGVRNKFENEGELYTQPPDIHINVDLEDGWIVEVQLLLRDVLTVKKASTSRCSTGWPVA